MNMDEEPSNISVDISTRIKYNGHLSSNGFVPYRSHVTLSCKVSFRGISEEIFDMVLIAFGLPNGAHVVPGNCFVVTKDSSKRCKISIKKATMSDQGTYRCLVYYFYNGKTIDNFKETVLSKCASLHYFEPAKLEFFSPFLALDDIMLAAFLSLIN